MSTMFATTFEKQCEEVDSRLLEECSPFMPSPIQREQAVLDFVDALSLERDKDAVHAWIRKTFRSIGLMPSVVRNYRDRVQAVSA